MPRGESSSHILMPRRMQTFQQYFELGEEESYSPFLSASARALSRNLHLKGSVTSACCLLAAFLIALFPDSILAPLAVLPLALVYLFSGTPALISALEDIFLKKDVNIDVLMTLSAFGAMSVGKGYEGGLLLVLFSLSQSLEDLVTLKAKSALRSVYEMAPTKACVIKDDGTIFEKSVYDIDVGTKIVVRAGEIVPLDGLVLEGQGEVSSAHLTGESRTKEVKPFSSVTSGSRLVQGSIQMQVTTKQADSTVMKIVHLVTVAESSKPKFSHLFERFGRFYALSILSITFLVLIFMPIFSHIPFFGDGGVLMRAMSFLITASPCALFIAVPIAYLSSLSAAVKKGAILKGGSVFDALIRCQTVAFDKTGTLTKGSFVFSQLFRIRGDEISPNELFGIIASLEQHVVHPIAQAIVKYATCQGVQFSKVSDVQVQPGIGVRGRVADCMVEVRAPSSEDLTVLSQFFEMRQETCPDGSFVIASLKNRDNEREGLFLLVFQDVLRDESAETIRLLKHIGKRVMMLSGDHVPVVDTMAKKLGVTDWKAELRPEDKLDIISRLSVDKEHGLVMVGDGMNDAPALARATVGVSMGQLSSASARDASDIVLLQNNLLLLPWLFLKGQSTKRLVMQNLSIAFCSIGLGTVASLFGLIPLWVAVIVHEGSTLVVGLNGLRLLRK